MLAFGRTAAGQDYEKILKDRVVRSKLLHGSDWPVPCTPPATRVGVLPALKLLREKNGLARDVLVKRRLGLDD